MNADFRCFGPGARGPLIVYLGRAGDAPQNLDRISIVGLARSEVAGVELRFAGGRREPIALRTWPDATFRTLALARVRPFPVAVVARDADDRVLAEVPLSAALVAPCAQPEACPGAAGSWADAIDPTAGAAN